MSAPRIPADPARKIVVFIPSFAGGGAERVTIAMADGLAGRGYDVQLVIGTSSGPLADSVPAAIRVHDLGVGRTLLAAGGLYRLLRRERPDVVLSAISHANIVATVVVRLLPRRPKLIVMHHNTTSISTRHTVRRRDRLVPMLCALAYRFADRITAVSHGVADDLSRSSHLPLGRVQVLPNPIDYGRIQASALEPIDEASVPAGTAPLLLAVGRLERQKAFDVLLRAVAEMTASCRLVILGEGPDRIELEALVAELQLEGQVCLPGFASNPYPYFRAADVYALSSRWEGLPTVLLEALHFPLRIVSTDCRSGPKEILDGVPGAELVPVEDAGALAGALDRALAAGPFTESREDWRAYDFAQVLDQLRDLVTAVSHS